MRSKRVNFNLGRAPGSSVWQTSIGLLHLAAANGFEALERFLLAVGSRAPLFPRAKMVRRASLQFDDMTLDVETDHPTLARRWKSYKEEAVRLGVYALELEKATKGRIGLGVLELGAASGIVSLFLSKFMLQRRWAGKVIAVEPAIQSATQIVMNSISLGLGVRVIPLAVGSMSEVDVVEEPSKGLVGRAVPASPETSNYYSVPTIDGRGLRRIAGQTTLVYVDALLNEMQILEEALPHFTDASFFLIEIDRREDFIQIQEALSREGFQILRRERRHFLFARMQEGQNA